MTRVRRRIPRERFRDGPTLAQRTAWADGHEDLMRRMREMGLVLPGEPHYVCRHPRMDDPDWRPARWRQA